MSGHDFNVWSIIRKRAINMAKNKSVNEERTKKALNYYTDQAKASNLLDAITQYGGFKTNAISIAISRGRISECMINAYVHIMGANPDYLTGSLELPESSNLNSQDITQIMNDDEAINIFTSLIQNQNIGVNSASKKNAIQSIKRILNNF